MNSKQGLTRIFICATFALFFLIATIPNVRSYPPFLKKAKALGLPAENCTYCHVNASGGEPFGARGKWLVDEKKRRSANAVEVEWLKEYQPDAQAAPSGATDAASAPIKKSDPNSNAEHAVMKLNREWADAIIRGDATATERFVAPEGTFTDAMGAVFDKTQLVSMLKSGDLKLESTTFDEVKVREHGDVTVVTYRSMDKGKYKGQDFNGQYRWTEIWVKRDGKWQQVAAHQSRVMP